MGKEKNRENTESTKQNKNNKAEEQTSSEIISENNGDFEEIIRGDNYIIAFEKDGIRLEIKDKEEDEVFGELSKNTRIIPYDVITVTVFFMWGNLSTEPVKSLVMRVNQTDDGFDEEGIPRYAMMRSSNPTSVFLRESEGSDKRFSFSLPRNDQQTTTSPGDIILYLGNSLVIYYDTNSWNFTRIGRVNGVSTREEMLSLLGGKGEITITLSLE